MSEITANNEVTTDGVSKTVDVQKSSPPVVASIVETGSMLERADSLNKSIQEGIKRLEELANRNEAVAARIMLSGKAEAGQVAKSPKDVQDEEATKMANDIVKRFRR